MHCCRLLVALLLFAFSCSPKDEVSPEPDVPKSPIKGTVVTLAECDLTKLDPGGVRITVSDSATGKTVATATSDQTGAYALTDIPAGTYHFVFEKAGFGTYKIFNRKHSVAKPDSVYRVQLAKEQYGVARINGLIVAHSGENLAVAGALTRPDGCWAHQGIVYFDDEPTVAYNNYKFVSSFDLSTTKSTPLSRIYALGLKPGQTIYYTAYIEQLHSIPYYDPTHGVAIRPNVDFGSKTETSFITLH